MAAEEFQASASRARDSVLTSCYRATGLIAFPANPASSEVILPQWQGLEIGDRIPDGPPNADCFYVVELLEPNKMLVLRSWTHLPKAMRDSGSKMEWTWGFYLDELDDSHTRFHFRVRGNLQPAWLRAPYNALIVPADFVMGRSLCLGLKARAEERLTGELQVMSSTLKGGSR